MSVDIRPQVLGVARRGERVLVSELVDPATGEAFYRPPGGGIEFGESSEEAVVREFDEEMGAAVEPVGYLGTVENRFTFAGERGHELVVVHEVEFVEDAHYDRTVIDGVDAGGAVTYEATWEPIDGLVAGDQPLYPEGIEALLWEESIHLVS